MLAANECRKEPMQWSVVGQGYEDCCGKWGNPEDIVMTVSLGPRPSVSKGFAKGHWGLKCKERNPRCKHIQRPVPAAGFFTLVSDARVAVLTCLCLTGLYFMKDNSIYVDIRMTDTIQAISDLSPLSCKIPFLTLYMLTCHDRLISVKKTARTLRI